MWFVDLNKHNVNNTKRFRYVNIWITTNLDGLGHFLQQREIQGGKYTYMSHASHVNPLRDCRF